MPPFNSLIQRAPVITGDICTTPECINASAFIKQYVNLTVDPCSDFYEYTCGSWLNSPEVLASNSSTTTFPKYGVNRLIEISNILEGTYEDIFKNLKTNNEGFHATDEAVIDRANFQEIQSFYDTCTNVTHIESLGPSSLYQDIAQIQHTLFPLSNTVNTTQNLAHTLASFVRQGLSSLISAITYININNHDYEIAALAEPEFYNITEEFMIKLVNWTMGDTHSNAYWMEEGQRVNFSYWSYEKVELAVKTYRNLTSEMYEAELSALNDTEEAIETKTLGEVQIVSSSIDWVIFLDDLVSPGYAQPTTSIDAPVPYLKLLDGIISTKTLEELQDYFIIRHIVSKISDIVVPFAPKYEEMLDNSTSKVDIANFDAHHFKEKLLSEPVNILSRRSPLYASKRREFCADSAGKQFADSVGRFYVLSTFGGSKEKIEIEQYVNDLQTSWLNHLPSVAWLDDETKTGAIEKIKALQSRVAYNTVNPDWRSPASIKSFYEGFTLDTSSYYKANRDISVFRNSRTWKKLSSKYIKNQWSATGHPQLINAFYFLKLNEFEIPIGILRRPYYDATFPKYLNFGGIGSVIGHELTHSLDSNGRHYNSSGYEENWWTNHSEAEFEKRSQCFVDQYFNESYINEITREKFVVDGKLTLSENIADSGGISIALMAYRDYINKNGQQPEPLLPDFETLTQEQMLFISMGVSRCAYISRNLAGFDASKVDPHSPEPSRINVPMRNSAEFAKAFQCAAGTPMNPQKNVEEKCTIW